MAFTIFDLINIYNFGYHCQQFICMKWGSRYGPNFVNRLYNSIKRHTKKPTNLYCFTDNKDGINKNVICNLLPEINLPNTMNTPWRKISVWQFPLCQLSGDILFWILIW